MPDLIVRGGLIVDGTGNPPYRGDLVVQDGRIAGLTGSAPEEAELIIDAEGLAVAPGFIDMHSHSDLTLATHPGAASSLLQGITTEVAGSCGWSMAPLKRETASHLLKMLCRGLTGEVPEQLGAAGDDGGAPAAWYSFGQYLDYLADVGTGTNLYPIVGQSLIRAHVMGQDRRPPTAGELTAMVALLEACLDEGARGLSTGRSYYPGAAASPEEIIVLARIVGRRGGLYTSHIKDEGAEVLPAVEEVVRIAREAGVRAQVSHHKAVGCPNKGRVDRTLALMEEARRDGVDITCDVYPYAFAQVFSLLSEFLGLDDVPLEEVEAKLREDDARERAVTELLKGVAREGRLPGPLREAGNYRIVAAGGDGTPVGRTLKEVLLPEPPPTGEGEPGREWARGLVDRAADLLLRHGLKIYLAATMDEDDVTAVLAHPSTMIGTDAFTLDRELPARVPIHPRHYGTFARVLGHYRRRGAGDLAGLVRKMTGLAAAKLRLADRGLLVRGYWADLVVFNPETVSDRATAAEPYLPPTGIEWVLVNGRVAVRNGAVSGERAGKVLRR